MEAPAQFVQRAMNNCVRGLCGQEVAIKFHPKRKPMAAAVATPEEGRRRVAELNQKLSFPSAAKVQLALYSWSCAKNYILFSLTAPKELTSHRHGTVATLCQVAWTTQGPLISYRSRAGSASADATYTISFLMQDIFSRYLWIQPIASKTQVRCVFEDIFNKSGRKYNELEHGQRDRIQFP